MGPLTAAEQFEVIRQRTPCPFAAGANLLGSPKWQPGVGVETNALHLYPHFKQYTQIVPINAVDGFVVAPQWSTSGSMQHLSRNFAQFIAALSKCSSRSEGTFSVALTPGWQFTFEGCRFFVSVFSNIYDPRHIRHSPTSDFILFQPEESFTRCGIGAGARNSTSIKRRVRKLFDRAGYAYPGTLIDARIEAQLYVLPRCDGDRDSQWWTYAT